MPYIFLSAAIALELVATTLLKYSEGYTKPLPTVLCIAMYTVCFFFLSKSLQHINLGIAYATWSGVGIIATTLISILFIFRQGTNAVTILGMIFVILGCVIMNIFGGASH